MEVGEKLTVVPVGAPLDVRATALLKPPEMVVVIVDEPFAPCSTVTEVGEAEMAKSGVVAGAAVEAGHAGDAVITGGDVMEHRHGAGGARVLRIGQGVELGVGVAPACGGLLIDEGHEAGERRRGSRGAADGAQTGNGRGMTLNDEVAVVARGGKRDVRDEAGVGRRHADTDLP